MRIVFVDLHSNEKMIRTFEKCAFNLPAPGRKHRYLLDFLEKNNITICNYVSKKGTYTSKTANIIFSFLYPFRLIGSKIILRKDAVDLRKIKTLKHISDIKEDDIILFYSAYKNGLTELTGTKAFKAVVMLHASCNSDIAQLLRNMDFQCFVNEADFSKVCTMFQKLYYGINQPFIILPFVFSERFQKKIPLNERMNKAVAVGTITYRTDEEFLNEYKDGCLQPLRKMIYDAADQSEQYYDCVSGERAEGVERKVLVKTDVLLVKVWKYVWNLKHIGQQKNYFSFDMVDKFNQYKMFICGEEVIGVPGIGFAEGMACGCAYIGCTKYDYASYGMIEGEHYIGYDGSLEDLNKKISYYQQHEDELEKIAENGYIFAHEHFSGDTVAKNLLDALIQQKGEYKKDI